MLVVVLLHLWGGNFTANSNQNLDPFNYFDLGIDFDFDSYIALVVVDCTFAVVASAFVNKSITTSFTIEY